MKSIILKTQTLAILFIGFVTVFSQNSMRIPQNTAFYMEINGKELNKKIIWEKFNPFLQELNRSKEKDKKPSWNDYSSTGIKYDAKQYHYGTFNDSLQTYNAHFMIDNKEKFQEFINSTKRKGLEISRKKNYSYIDIDDNTFVAWNGSHAYLTIINYSKPLKDDIWTDDVVTDSTVIETDSAVIVTDSVWTGDEKEEKPFDYKEEIKYLKDEIKYIKDNIKSNNAEIVKYQKDIKYLEKHHRYPEEKKETVNGADSVYSEKNEEVMPPPVSQDDYYSEEDRNEEDSLYQKKMDSIHIENFKINRKFAENSFDQYFSSNFEIEVPGEMLTFRDQGSDVYVFTDYGKILNEGIYGKMFRHLDYTRYLSRMYNLNSTYNLYFDKDKVRLVNNHQHKNPEMQKHISDVYKGKKNKKLTALINDQSIGYYAMNLNGYSCFDMMYSFFEDAGEQEYQKELQLMMETVKIVLDEEAISKIAPGNAIFVLNTLKSKKVEYTDYDYDDDYNEKEVKKTKEVMVPDFTFAFATENEGYWKRIFDVLTTNKNFVKKFSKSGDVYSFKEGKGNGYIDQLFFTVKDGLVYLTTSTENLKVQSQSSASSKWMKDAAKYPMSGKFDIQKLLSGLEKELNTPSERKKMNLIRKNAGDVYFKTEVKGGSIQTEINYTIKNSSDNSLMYFFDVFDEIFKSMEADKKQMSL